MTYVALRATSSSFGLNATARPTCAKHVDVVLMIAHMANLLGRKLIFFANLGNEQVLVPDRNGVIHRAGKNAILGVQVLQKQKSSSVSAAAFLPTTSRQPESKPRTRRPRVAFKNSYGSAGIGNGIKGRLGHG